MTHNFSQTAAYIWSLADLLRGDFKQSQYGRVILPFTILRRLERVLESSKPKVLEQVEKLKAIEEAGGGRPREVPPQRCRAFLLQHLSHGPLVGIGPTQGTTPLAGRTLLLAGAERGLTHTGLNDSSGLAVDLASNKLCLADCVRGSIIRSNLDGTGVETIFSVFRRSPHRHRTRSGPSERLLERDYFSRTNRANLDGKRCASLKARLRGFRHH